MAIYNHFHILLYDKNIVSYEKSGRVLYLNDDSDDAGTASSGK